MSGERIGLMCGGGDGDGEAANSIDVARKADGWGRKEGARAHQ